MRSIAYHTPLPISAEESLIDSQQDTPPLGAKDLLVRVKAISVNPVDVKIRANVSPAAGTTKILGWDAAGIVTAVGSETSLFRPGDEVFYAGALDRPGTNAQEHVVDERIVGPKPTTLDFAEAAALPLTSITAWEALFDRLDVNKPVPGATHAILILGGAGGVGSMAIQLARALTSLTVIATASRPESRHWCQTMGAHHVIDHNQALAPQLTALGITQPAFVFSTTHTAEHAASIAELIAPQGRLCLIDDPETLNIMPFKRKSVSIHWEFMFTRSLLQTADITQQHTLLKKVAALIDQGKIRTTLHKTFSPIDVKNLKKAHSLIESGRSIGKIVLSDWGD